MTFGLGNRCSIRLSYGTALIFQKFYLLAEFLSGVCYHFATEFCRRRLVSFTLCTRLARR